MYKLRSLPIEKFKKRFREMYNFANDEKKEMIHLFEEGVDEHILKVDSFIEKTRRKMQLDEVFELV